MLNVTYFHALKSEISKLQKVVDRSVTISRGYSERTQKILQFLTSHPDENHTQIIADFVKAPRNSVFKTLQRLVKKGLVKRAHRGFWKINQHLLTTSEKCHFVGLHGVGLCFDVPRLGEKLFESGLLLPMELRSGGYYRGRSRRFGADFRLFSNSAYYQERCPVFPVSELMLRYDDALEGLHEFTRGLADVKGAWLNDFEIGLDVDHDLFWFDALNISKIIIYQKHGKARVHVQFNQKHHPLPPSRDTEISMLADLGTAITELQDILETCLRTLCNPLNPNISTACMQRFFRADQHTIKHTFLGHSPLSLKGYHKRE